MKISSQDLIPVSLSQSLLSQVKANPYDNSQMTQGSQLQSTTPLSEDTVSLSRSGTAAETISMENMTEKKIYVDEISQVWAAVYQNVGSGGKAYEALSDLGAAFSDEMGRAEWQDLATAAVNAGDQVDALVEAAAEYGRRGKSIDDLAEFLSFAADLSEENLSNFLSAVKDNPDQAERMIEIAERLGSDLSGLYLKTASLNQDDLEDLNAKLLSMTAEDGENSGLTSYFSLAAETEDQGLALLDAFGQMTESTRDLVSSFGTTRVAGQDLEDFVTLASSAGETAITEILAQADTLEGSDLQNLIKAASNAEGRMNEFLSALDNAGQSRTETRSQFLAVAANAEQALPDLLDNLERVDIQFAASLSAVDTVNYIEAVDNAGDEADRLSEVGGSLEGRERSLFFYAATQAQGDDVGDLLDQVEALDGHEQSEFLLQAANQGNNGPADEDIYLKGILSNEAFKDYQATRANLNSWQADSLAHTVEDIDAQSREAFLDASAAAAEIAPSFLTMFDRLSPQDQDTLLEISEDLGTGEQAQFVKGAVKAGGDVQNFLALTQTLMDGDDSGQVVSDFLDAAEAAGPSQVKDLTDFVSSLNKGGQKSFLSAVTNTHYSLSQLLEAGKQVQAGSNEVQGVFTFVSKGLITLEQAKTYYS